MRAVAVIAALLSGCAFAYQTPVPSGWRPNPEQSLECEARWRFIALDVLFAAPYLTYALSDVGAGEDGRPTNYGFAALGAAHVLSALLGTYRRTRCRRSRALEKGSGARVLATQERWWLRDTPCPGGAKRVSDKDGSGAIVRYYCSFDGVREGPETEFEKTVRVREANYRHGKKHGLYREWFSNGDLKVRGQYHEGARLLGTWSQLDELGRAMPVDMGSGRVIRIVGGVRIEAGEYSGGKRDGTWTVWDREGRVVEEGKYEAGKRQGRWIYSQRGQRREWVTFANGVRDGLYQRWDASGRLVETGNYRGGVREGSWVAFDANEKPVLSGKFVADKRDGEWLVRRADGVVVKEIYKAGKLMGAPPGE